MKQSFSIGMLLLLALLAPGTLLADAEPASTGIVIDLSELTLYFGKNGKTYPIAAGKLDGEQVSFTPTGSFSVIEKNPHPVCTIPGFAPTTYGTRFMLLNAMGRYKLRRIGIHGTDHPDSINSYVSSGCIRMRNEDIEEIYPLIAHNTAVEIKE